MVGHLAVLGSGALTHGAGVDTLLVLASLLGRALTVASASHLAGACNEEIIKICRRRLSDVSQLIKF